MSDSLEKLIRNAAASIGGTEAVAFAVQHDLRNRNHPWMDVLVHVRPDSSDAAVRAAAISAFREIVSQCILEDKNGALRIGEASNGRDPQFCLVTLARSAGEVTRAAAFIVRCRDEYAALHRLKRVQAVADQL